MKKTLSVNQSIFDKYPTFRRGIVVALDLDNSRPCPELKEQLDQIIHDVQQSPIDFNVDFSTNIWKQAHREFGSNPNKFPPSHFAMRKRIQRGKSIPFISPTVAVMNCNSLSANTSVGGDDIDRVSNHLILRHATGDEVFVPLFEEGVKEHPEPGEVIYADEQGRVMCRRWNWRNSHVTRIQHSTTNMVMNIDGLGSDCDSMIIRTRDRVAEMLACFCGARTYTTLLTPSEPDFEFFCK
ncbi:B3/4 domain protein [Gimesia maris]|uniref:B3/B4 domain-containing protein n=1 Tax=Gimesia maris TaxID=122 RepID=UPI001187F6B1|nr:phenylalanine--tRNA ligase beta subunit-related protein [Gimesia maris]QDT78264.1 B3/4 domain protein [Gimesia maris]